MPTTPLYDNLAQKGARMGEHCGSVTALAFGEPRAEFASLVHGCAVYDLSWRTPFRIAGRDRARWFNGMVTNNVRDLPVGSGNYNFVLTAQGRIQGDLYAYNRGEEFLATTDQAQLQKLLTQLRKYIIMDQVEVADLSGDLTAVGIQGPQADAVLEKAGLANLPGTLGLAEIDWHSQKLLSSRTDNAGIPSYEIWMPSAAAAGVWEALAGGGAEPAGVEALEMFRVTAGIPRYGIDIRDRDLPQETGQMSALNFAKGCYIGQEIVERIRSRGGVHRTLAGFTIQGAPPSPGSKLQLDGKEIGEITSVVQVPTVSGDRVLALGYLRREAAKPGTSVQIEGSAATVHDLPFAEILNFE